MEGPSRQPGVRTAGQQRSPERWGDPSGASRRHSAATTAQNTRRCSAPCSPCPQRPHGPYVEHVLRRAAAVGASRPAGGGSAQAPDGAPGAANGRSRARAAGMHPRHQARPGDAAAGVAQARCPSAPQSQHVRGATVRTCWPRARAGPRTPPANMAAQRSPIREAAAVLQHCPLASVGGRPPSPPARQLQPLGQANPMQVPRGGALGRAAVAGPPAGGRRRRAGRGRRRQGGRPAPVEDAGGDAVDGVAVPGKRRAPASPSAPPAAPPRPQSGGP